MLDIRLSDISPTSGPLSDGFALGNINRTPLVSLQSTVTIATNVNAYRRDANGGGFNFVDVSAEAVSEVDDTFLPFGDDVAFTSGDSIYVSDTIDIEALYFHITTSGVWTGDGLEVYDSTNGVTANRLLSNIVDDTNGFRAAAGIYKLGWDRPATPSVAFTPVPGDIPSRRWLQIKLKGMTSATTAPKLRRLWIKHYIEDVVHVDFTAPVSGAVDDPDFGVYESVSNFLVPGEVGYYGFPFLSIGLDLWLYRRVGGDPTSVWEYLASDDTWKPLQNLIDGSDETRNGPVTAGPTPTFSTIRWDMPSDWSEKSLELNPNPAVSAYWVRRTTVAHTPIAPALIILPRFRTRSYGEDNATGLRFKEAATINHITFTAGVPPVTDAVVQLANINTGQSVTYTHPAASLFSGDLPEQHIELPTALNIGAGDSLLISHVSGGSIQDLELHLS